MSQNGQILLLHLMVVIKQKTFRGARAFTDVGCQKPRLIQKIFLSTSLFPKNDFPPTGRAARRVLPCAQIQVLPCAQIQSCGSTFCPQRFASASYMSPTSATALFFRIELALLKYNFRFSTTFPKMNIFGSLHLFVVEQMS